jgi:hypothetical protein
MLEMRWLDHLPDSSLEAGSELANELFWFISTATDGKTWIVRGGSSVLLVTDNQEAFHAFLYGLGLAYAVIPQTCWDKLKVDVAAETGVDFDDFID